MLLALILLNIDSSTIQQVKKTSIVSYDKN